MEPDKQVEIQLGHMCNNRCVFCVSGQRTGMGEARPLETQPILDRITEAWDLGHRKITLLGGEPTLQPGFLDVVRHSVGLGFEDIVIFTNGVKTAREAFLDEVLATGGRFTWRISIQGATKEHHERTTKKARSFDRILKTMQHLRARGQRITVNMCVVTSNFESVHEFPALCARYGVDQLHLDMMRPLDAGVRTEEELRNTMPRYSDMVPSLTRMVQGFVAEDPDFDVNIGNLPFCIAPELARWIHHDGNATSTIAIDGDDRLSKPWDKYFIKRRDKFHPQTCQPCVFRKRCSGVFETYAQFHGVDELRPIRLEGLAEVDPQRFFLALSLEPFVTELARWTPPAPYGALRARSLGDADLEVSLPRADGAGQSLAVVLRRPDAPGAVARFEQLSLHLSSPTAGAEAALRGLVAAMAAAGARPVAPLGDDAFVGLARSIAVRLRRLRAAAPFGRLDWVDVQVSEAGARAELALTDPDARPPGRAPRAVVWLAEVEGRARGGYHVEGEATPALVEGLRALMAALERSKPGTRPARADAG